MSNNRMRSQTMSMAMTGLVAVCCLVLGCAADLRGVPNSAEAVLSRLKRKAVNTCQLTRHSVEEISFLTKDTLQEIQETILNAIHSSLQRQPTADESSVWRELLAMKAQLEQTRAELISTKAQLQDTRADLATTKTQFQNSSNVQEITMAELRAVSINLVTSQELLHDTRADLATTKAQLQDTRNQMEQTKADLLTTQTQLQNASSTQELTMAELEATKAALQVVTEQSTPAGSTFVRWGRTQCTSSSELVYSGVVGGSFYDHTGAAANALCLTMTPQFDNETKPTAFAKLHGAEYQQIPGHLDHDVPCAVCRVPKSTTIMMAATLTCPSGWTPQYTGHLVAGRFTHKAASEYLCLDGQPEDVPNSRQNLNGYLFYYTLAQCGSLPCGPYIQDRVITCVVCSK